MFYVQCEGLNKDGIRAPAQQTMQISQHSVVHSYRLQQPTHKPLHLQQEPLSSLIDVIADAQGPEWPADQRKPRASLKRKYF